MRHNSDFLGILAATPLFAGLSEARVAALVEGLTPTDFARGEALYAPDAFPQAIAVVLSGAALVRKVRGDGHRLFLRKLSRGDVFGMASLFGCGEPYPTEIRAESTCRVLFLPKEWLEAAFLREPNLTRNYIALLSERIRFLNRRIETLAGDDMRARAIRMLQDFTREQGRGDTFRLPYPKAMLAEALGVGRASLYRALAALEADGVIKFTGRDAVWLRQKEE